MSYRIFGAKQVGEFDRDGNVKWLIGMDGWYLSGWTRDPFMTLPL